MTIFVGDKLMLLRPYGDLQNVGSDYMVADIRAGLIILKDPVTRRAVCGISIEELFNYFVKADEHQGWTSWSILTDYLGNAIGHFRTNRKKVQVRMWDGVKAEACCHRVDNFDLAFGLRLAYLRADAKRVMKAMDELDKQMNEYCAQLSSIGQEQKHMMASLYKTPE